MYESFILPGEDDDSRLVDDGFFMEVAPNRKQIIESYLSRLSFFDQGRANFLAKDFQVEGRPLADTIALIPIAAHQETAVVGHALDQYAAQSPKRPFTVLLYLR